MMSCCGQNRASLKQPTLQTRTQSAAEAMRQQTELPRAKETVKLRFARDGSILLRGAMTGQSYYFSNSEPEQLVDTRDAESMLHTILFRRASGSDNQGTTTNQLNH